ncbi:MAG: M20/M25/M40 family metallo-hydrolase [Phycisphaerales bacterium]|nr:M20/M25/M40 family metallo-hydrolase [Phycisphaerales bacterium]
MNIDLLKRLCEVPGVPGREERVRALIESELGDLFDTTEVDAMGNLICRRKARTASGNIRKGDAKTLMLLCHMDEIGFYVSSIDENGYLWLSNAGGFDPRNLFSRRVLVVTDNGDFQAVMNPGGRPVHISSPDDRKKVPEVKEFFIDTGMTAAQVKKNIKVGDYVVMDEPFLELGTKCVSKAMDNRVACWLGIESVRALAKSKKGNPCDIVVAFTTQEEVGLRGAKTSSYAVRPDYGIGIDVTLSCDTPGVPAAEAVTTQGKGFALHIKDSSFISDYEMVQNIEKIAKKGRIPYQRSILAAGGQDGAAAQQAAAGAKAVGITVGTRYIHTVTEMIDKKDLKAACDVLAAAMSEIK